MVLGVSDSDRGHTQLWPFWLIRIQQLLRAREDLTCLGDEDHHHHGDVERCGGWVIAWIGRPRKNRHGKRHHIADNDCARREVFCESASKESTWIQLGVERNRCSRIVAPQRAQSRVSRRNRAVSRTLMELSADRRLIRMDSRPIGHLRPTKMRSRTFDCPVSTLWIRR